MKSQHKKHHSSFLFIVNKKQVSKNKILKTSVLYDKVALSASQSVTPYSNLLNTNLKSFEFNILKKAYLNDELIVKQHIQKLSNSELELKITVAKKKEKHQDIICKAIYGYTFKNAS
ncbi:hypothetical protein [Tenacibaculum maritimum]|uniref:hypothetical protein n=1 Tax=Tenacibaculum maritimum TaxID=107401 RepID=UPI0010A41E41|nr:hypothetical protein [Tenacibaculum maritimum]QCD61880.1 hypothetical protein B9C57_04660 [Tenacibaculum maritimum]